MGLPLLIHDVKTMASAPRFTISLALATAFFPGHPPQLINPTISTGPVYSKTPNPLLANLKSVVPRHIASVCWHLIIPTFMVPPAKLIGYKLFTGGGRYQHPRDKKKP